MTSNQSPDDGVYNEKSGQVVSEPSLPGRKASVNNSIRNGSRKGSLVASLKAGYGLAEASDEESVKEGVDLTHRKLKARHIQLIGIGGTIGTALFVQIGRGLINGGPASLFMAFTIWCTFILAVTNCVAEMVTYLPLSSPFIRFADRYVDEAFGVAAGYNFFLFEAFLVPFEVVACNFIIRFWTDVIPTGAVIAFVILAYAAANLFAVKYYGETEFWLALGKMLLIIGLICYTFIVMLGGNPLNDRFGFRYWKEPGAFNTQIYGYTGSLGRWLGFLQCLIQASFTIAGPDYVAMAAGEAENPRYIMPRAFKAVFYRLMFFFVIGSLCVGIVVPQDDPQMVAAFSNNEPGAAGSPYVASMTRLRIPVLPHIVNAMVLGSAFSAGNSYCYCASRSLYGMALEGKAPKIFTRCTRNGVPIYCVGIVLAIALLSFLELNSGSSTVLNWFVSLITASQLINFSVMTFTFLRWKKACEVQGLDRNTLVYKAWWTPFCAYYALTATMVMTFVGGYTVFLPGFWDIPTFLFSYTMVGVFPVLFFGWKFFKKTKWRAPHEVELRPKELAEIDAYERAYVYVPPKHRIVRYWDKIFS